MKKLLISIIIGVVAGIVDVIPMIIQRLDWYSNISAFVQWVILGIIICHIEIGLKGILKGFVIAEALAIPIMIIVAKTEIFSVVPIFIMTAILGMLVGYVGEKINS